MLEFGSDFHFIEAASDADTLFLSHPNAMLYADGRIALAAILQTNNWRRIWLPSYFCYEVVSWMRQAVDIQIVFYPDYPGCDDVALVNNLPYKQGDVLYRVNYFGMRNFRSEKSLSVDVIEDHTHDLIGPWAMQSDADWCVASLRKTLPIPEGGVVWSPKGLRIPDKGMDVNINTRLSADRWKAMELKASYVAGEQVDKTCFRSLFSNTEEQIDQLMQIADIDSRTRKYLQHFNIRQWYDAKRGNLDILQDMLDYESLVCESKDCNLFSYVVLLQDRQQRDEARRQFADHGVYTAILWQVPDDVPQEVKHFSHTMLSIHADGRYGDEAIHELAMRIRSIL